jgi:hypothetical protein
VIKGDKSDKGDTGDKGDQGDQGTATLIFIFHSHINILQLPIKERKVIKVIKVVSFFSLIKKESICSLFLLQFKRMEGSTWR